MLSADSDARQELWKQLIAIVEQYKEQVEALPVAPELDPEAIRFFLAPFDFRQPLRPPEALKVAVTGLTKWQVHTAHPRYFGLFNPSPTTMGIAADALVAAFNPQLAAWSHSPFAAEVELHLIRALGGKFGFDPAKTDGTFCCGGMEANHTAVLTALVHRFSGFAEGGARALPAQPVLYVSEESHHSFLKAARMVGIGTQAVREVAVDGASRMQTAELAKAIAADRAAGMEPFLVVATAGTTSAGAVDPIRDIASVAEDEGLWLHTDAAWGGAAVLVPELRALLEGIERSASITFDAHKWLSVPMGAGVYLTQNVSILSRTFQVVSAYMPKDASSMDVVDPHLHSMQWSRRFTGLKLLLSLLVAGWKGYEEAIRHQTAMGELLRRRLADSGWEIVNSTPLPVVCFAEPAGSAESQRAIAARVVSSGEAWISPTVIGGRTVLRACITHYGTNPEHLEALVASLNRARC